MKFSRQWLWLLFLIPVILGLKRLHLDVEVLNLLPTESPVVQGLKLYQQNFANARELIITVESPDAELTEQTARSLGEALRRQGGAVESAVWQPPWLERPEQMAELVAFLWLNQPPGSLRELTDRLAPANRTVTLAAAREQLATSLSPAEIGQLSYDPYGLTRLPESTAGAAPGFGQGQQFFVSGDGTFRIIFVRARGDLATYRECERWLNLVRGTVDSAIPPADRESKQIRLGFTGRPAFVAEIAGGMERDTLVSVGGTALIIGILFWLAHRRWKPMVWLLTLLALILVGTLALGGLLFGTVNVVSIGFAAILLGLAVDYAVVHYQEALAHPDLTVPEIRRAIAPSIIWAAVTTITAFLVLNFGGLPGLAQLGSLVGIGVALSALVMVFAFLPPLFPERYHRSEFTISPQQRPSAHVTASSGGGVRAWRLTALLVLISMITLVSGLPGIDPTANALRPRSSQAYAALETIKSRLGQGREPLWLLVSGRSEMEVAGRLDEVRSVLERALSDGEISSFTLPDLIWPRAERQAANRQAVGKLVADREALVAAAEANGFTGNSMALAGGIFDAWQRAANGTEVFWPTNQTSRWIFQRLVARSAGTMYALGLVYPGTNQASASRAVMPKLVAGLPREQVWLSGWELLGADVFQNVKDNLWRLVLPMIVLVILSLGLAFRRAFEVGLSLAILILSGLCLLMVMRWLGWSWNLLNLVALPLILGTGVDYSIFMQLALRRHRGDLTAAHRSVGKALLLCGATAVTGFGSLAWSGNAGMASLGKVCAVGIGFNMLISVYLLPTWWASCNGTRSDA